MHLPQGIPARKPQRKERCRGKSWGLVGEADKQQRQQAGVGVSSWQSIQDKQLR